MRNRRFHILAATLTATLVMASAPWRYARAGAAEPATTSPAGDVHAGYLLSPKAFRAAVQTVMPSVVMIETYGVAGPTGPTGRSGGPAPRGRQFGGISKPGEGPTTGLVISPDGFIITSTYNFIRHQALITVVLQDGSQHLAKLLGRDDTRKLCLLKIDAPAPLSVPRFLAPNELQVGQWAVSIGVGYGSEDPAISAGIVSATHRISDKAVQTDANTSPANYGGPLIDIQGRVIGICVPMSPGGQTAEAGAELYDSGIGFAVPLNGAEHWLERLKAGGQIEPGKLGIQVGPAELAEADRGVAVQMVLGNSPAGKAGLRKDDLILAIDSRPIRDLMDLRAIMGRYAAGDTVAVHLRRDGVERDVTVTLDAGADDAGQPPMMLPGPTSRPAPIPTTRPATRPATRPGR